ncbi:MAG: acetyl/propionyl/methylcrotonyl-CoA carboxylase subunit alpha [Planctomycetota bacterium]
MNWKPSLIRKVLVANRGEIANRVFQTCREFGIRSVAVYSDADADSVHRYAADESVRLGPAPVSESYLNVDAILAAAVQTGADSVHPGYGFLSENAAFARAVEAAGLRFVGPTPDQIAAMGDKVNAREFMRRAGVPVIPGSEAAVSSLSELRSVAEGVGFPLLVKAAGGGGGKGIRRIDRAEELDSAFERATSEARSAFGDARVYLERYVHPARHVEAQILGDGLGGALFLGERECSLQRKHQKLVEETPSPVVDETVRGRIREAALAGVRALRYRGAGTMEFLYDDARREFYFLEMNTRLQVEHPVTEMVTGLDLVAEQLRIAEGLDVSLPEEPVRRGHAIEFRIYAEDPYRGFSPSTGRIGSLRLPHAPFTRIDAALRRGTEVTPYYDPLLAKAIAWGGTREVALRRLEALLQRVRIGGIHTTLPLGLDICRWDDFRSARFSTSSLEDYLRREVAAGAAPEVTVQLAAILARGLLTGKRATATSSGPTSTDPRESWKQTARNESVRRF